MSKSSPQAPPAPDPQATASAQSQSNIATAIANAQLNRVNQQTPWGSIAYTQGPAGTNGVPTYSSQISLSPQQQQLLDQQQGRQLQSGQLAQQYLGQVSGKPLDLSSLAPINNRGQMYQGAVNAPQAQPQAQPQMQPQGQPGQQPQGQPPQINPQMLQQLMAMLGQQGGAQGAATTPATAAPAAPASSGPAIAPTFQDYQTYQSGLGADPFSGSAHPEYAQPLTQDQWSALSPQDQWARIGGRMGLTASDPRYAALASQLGANGQPVIARYGSPLGTSDFTDPNKVLSGNGVQAYVHSNMTPGAERGESSDNRWWQPVLAGLGMEAGAIGGLGAAGFFGGAGAAGAGAAGAGTGAFDVGGSTGFGDVFGGAGAASAAAPVTDLSIQATQPSLWQQAAQNFTQGRGVLGMGNPVSRAASLLPQLLRNNQGGSK